MSDIHITLSERTLTRAYAMVLVIGALVLFASIASATTPNPGHPWTEVGDGTFQVTGPTALRTYTFPDANATVLTKDAQASTTQLSAYKNAYFGATATSTFDSAGVLTLITPLALTSGGTAASLTASNGGIVYSGASALAILSGTATANKVLMSGASAAPVWSTPTYPNASATSRKIIVSDGTNFVASTETYATPGTAGQVLMSNGTNWVSSSPRKFNQSTASQGAGFSSDTYVTGSSITIATPSTILQAGARYHMLLSVSKTAAGTATPILTVRYGTAGGTGDTALCAATFGVGTAAVDTGIFEVFATFRAVGASAVLQCSVRINHNLTTTGLANQASPTREVTSSSFNSAAASNEIIGVSLNGGASAAWTITLVQAELENLAN